MHSLSITLAHPSPNIFFFLVPRERGSEELKKKRKKTERDGVKAAGECE